MPTRMVPPTHTDRSTRWRKAANTTEQGKNLKTITGKKQSFQMEPVVEPNEEVQLDFAGPLPGELKKDAYLFVALDKWSKFPQQK